MSEKLRVRQILVVEGKYDAAALSALVDGLILTTDGFAIFKDRPTQQLLKELGRTRGVILLTDPDAAGFKIRNFVANLVGEQFVRQAYVPAVEGKERRKPQPGKEGLLGVEGLPAEVLRQAILDAGAQPAAAKTGRPITYGDLFSWGLSGTAGSRGQRYVLLKRLGLPPRLSKKALCQVLNSLYTFEEVQQLVTGLEEVESSRGQGGKM